MNRGAIVLLLIIFLSLFAGMVEMTYGAIPQIEREALIALYNSTNGDNWIIKSGWKASTPHTDGFAPPGTENKWYGITCDEGNTMVLRIDLNNNHLVGIIPPELGNLTNLQHLYMTQNQLSGSIPTTLSNLSNLTELGLNGNQLTGSIPTGLANLSQLKTLDLNTNQLTDSIPSGLGSITTLTLLDLHSNQLTGQIPSELGNLKELSALVLSFNQLTGYIPPKLGELSKLLYLQLDSNLLIGAIPSDLGQLSQLQWLSLAFNQLTGTIPSKLDQLSNLSWLQLDSNQLVGSIPLGLANLTNLQHLSLSSNQLTGNIPPELGNLSKLNDLSLGSNQLMGKIPPELGDLSQLYYLDLSGNRLTGSIPQAMGKLVNLNVGGSDFRWNGLHTGIESLRTLLNNAQDGGDWESTQTIAPERVAARALSTTTIKVSWKPIIYTGDEGGYRVLYSLTPDDPYTFFGSTATKFDDGLEVTGLSPATKYYFVVQTRTEPHEKNQNTVESEYSAKVSAETLKYIISGRVATETGKGIAGVTMLFSSPADYMETDVNGNYSHAVEDGWSGTVRPTKTGYTFEPEKITFKNVTSDQPNTNFKVKSFLFYITGNVTSGGEGVEGVTLTFTADNGETGTVQTNSYGSYSYEVPFGWIGWGAPSKGDLLFYPQSIKYDQPVTRNWDHQDYQLCVSLTLTVARKQDNTLIIRKEYAEIEFKAILIGISASTVKTFNIYRKEANGDYQPNKEFTATNQTNSFLFTYRDEYLEKGKTYTYIARAIDAQGKIIGESKEKTI